MGYIAEDGSLAISFIFNTAGSFKNGLAIVEVDEVVYAWEFARKTNTAESYEYYINFPGAQEAEKKVAMAKLTQFDALSWKDAIVANTLESYVAYYNSERMVKTHTEDAAARLRDFDDKEWAGIADSRDRDSYKSYIENTHNPCASHKDLAQGLIDMLDANEIVLTLDFDTAYAKYSNAIKVGVVLNDTDRAMYELSAYRHQLNEDCRAFTAEPTLEKGMELIGKYPKKGLDSDVSEQIARCIGESLNAYNVGLASKIMPYAATKETKEFIKEQRKAAKKR